MASRPLVLAAVTTAVLLSMVRSARGEENPCASTITRANLVRCALQASTSVRAEVQGVEAMQGRRLAASTWLPSNPIATVSVARRTAPGGSPSATNWNASLAQEIEIGGQRGLRRDVAESQLVAQQQRVVVSRREVALSAWVEFFEIASSQEELRLATRLSAVAGAVGVVARARAEQGLSSAVEADVAETTSVRITQARFASERRLAQAQARLSLLLSHDPAAPPAIDGDLDPIADVEAAARQRLHETGTTRPEVRVMEAERRVLLGRADLFRRLRLPNPSLSLFVQNDGFNERVMGLGLTLPIPLPAPVGRTYAGDIAESEAMARRASTEMEKLQRQLRLGLVTALQDFTSRRAEVESFRPERLQRAENGLRALAQEIQAGRFNVRDALVMQQSLIEFLQAHVAARRALALSSIELARAAGLPLEGAGS